jgi:DNA segregation ATPase FtsK/SpoIIIE-like protein
MWTTQFFEQAVRLVVNNGQASTSMLQRRFRIGYTRAARIVEMMEEKGIVGPLNGAKAPRDPGQQGRGRADVQSRRPPAQRRQLSRTTTERTFRSASMWQQVMLY